MSNGLPDTTKGRVYVATNVVNPSIVFSEAKALDHHYYCEIIVQYIKILNFNQSILKLHFLIILIVKGKFSTNELVEEIEKQNYLKLLPSCLKMLIHE